MRFSWERYHHYLFYTSILIGKISLESKLLVIPSSINYNTETIDTIVNTWTKKRQYDEVLQVIRSSPFWRFAGLSLTEAWPWGLRSSISYSFLFLFIWVITGSHIWRQKMLPHVSDRYLYYMDVHLCYIGVLSVSTLMRNSSNWTTLFCYLKFSFHWITSSAIVSLHEWI